MAGQPEVIRDMVKCDKCVLEGREARTGRADRLTILVPFVGTALYDLMVYV